MAKSKKDKKLARKERQENLRKATLRVQEKIQAEMLEAGDEEEEEVQYILSEDEEEAEDEEQETTAETAAPSSEARTGSSKAATAAVDEEDEDRVKLPSMAPVAKPSAATAPAAGRKHHRIAWEQLKVQVVERFGPQASKVVSEHDGNAEDPFFSVQMKMQYGSVPVPRHWTKLRSFLSLQADREEAVNVVPASIHALGIHKVRATKQKHLAPDQKAIVACFMTGTPLQHRDFDVPLSRHGEVFYEGKWCPKTRYEPGKLSQRAQQALGMTSASPPPWLYSMQIMKRLPPAYPAIRLPGLNAPIPAGAQWGRAQGQWGEAPRDERNNLMFPSVMGETAGAAPDPFGGWGRVPALVVESAETGAGPASPPPPAATPSPPPPQTQQAPPASAARPVVTPTPFQPKAFVPHGATAESNRYGPTTPQEYVRVQDSGVGSVVAVGHTYVQRGEAQAQAARHRPPPPPPPAPAKSKQTPRPAPAQPASRPNQPNKSGTTRF